MKIKPIHASTFGSLLGSSAIPDMDGYLHLTIASAETGRWDLRDANRETRREFFRGVARQNRAAVEFACAEQRAFVGR